MSIAKKGLRKFVRNDRVFYWCVKEDDDDDDRLYLVIHSDDNLLHISYMLDQKNRLRAFSPKNPLIIVKGREFKGLEHLGGCWERFLVPDWADQIITPSLVGKIIDWCLTPEEVTRVDYRGEIIKSSFLA